jgi:hypothetical protein
VQRRPFFSLSCSPPINPKLFNNDAAGIQGGDQKRLRISRMKEWQCVVLCFEEQLLIRNERPCWSLRRSSNIGK